jgi:GT2 family glycosyltransferase
LHSQHDEQALRIFVVVATVGRASLLCRVLPRLDLQTREPDGVIVVGASDADVAGVAEAHPTAEVIQSAKGLCRQRNAALQLLEGRADVVIFFDDDFIPAPDYLQEVERLFLADGSLIGLTGVLIADGAHTGEIDFDRALCEIALPDRRPQAAVETTAWLYGCNMAIRFAAAPELRFDEALPLYGWQEDVDYSARLGRLGGMLRTADLTGIHLGTRSGRTSGRRLGYSQVANIVYLRRKQTISARHGFGLMARNIAANLARSLWPEPEIDRRGRLIGNAMALADCALGKADTRRIEML